MNGIGRGALAIVATCWCFAPAWAGDDSPSAELSAAGQTAHALLESVCDEFECSYSGVVVSDASWGNQVNFIVRFSCEGKRCEEALLALVARGAEEQLSFSRRPPPAREASDPMEPGEPGIYDLIHEIDPDTGEQPN
jgi:hypothetical protein